MKKSRLHRWILTHDDRWSFIFLYLFLAVLLSICISLFWLVLVVGFHGLLEWICQREGNPEASFFEVLGRVLWSVKLDISLIFFSLALGIYMDIIMGAAGLGSAARAGMQGVKSGARFVIWEKALRAILLSLDDLVQLLRAFQKGRARSAAGSSFARERESLLRHRAGPLPTASPQGGEAGWRKPWSLGDRFSLVFGGLCLGLLLTSPWLTGHGVREVLDLLMLELHPWPVGQGMVSVESLTDPAGGGLP